MEMENHNDKGGPVGIGTKGTIVSLMEKELQLERRYKIQHHLPVRSEVVSVSCGNMLVASTGCKNLQIDGLAKSGSCREQTFYVREVLAKSGSVRDSRSKNDSLPPSGTPNRRKKLVSYHDAASSGMLSFLDNEQPSMREHKKHRPVEDSVPILSPDKKSQDKHHSLPSPGKFFASSHVQIVDTRCYRGGRELFRQSSSSSPKRLSFWRL